MSETVELTGALKAIYEHIEATNAAFKEMTLEQKRVQIAKDVLLQLEVGRIQAASTYFSNNEIERIVYNGMRDPDSVRGEELRDLFKKMPNCLSCAMGAIFVAVVDREDDLTVAETLDRGGPCNRRAQEAYLAVKRTIFSSDDLDNIEEAFEKNPGFCPAFEGSRQRMQRVMMRIIELDGNLEGDPFPATYKVAKEVNL